MELVFQNASAHPFKILKDMIGGPAYSLLEELKERSVFIILTENTAEIYQNQNIKNFLEFELNDDYQIDPEITIRVSNSEHNLTPVIVILRADSVSSRGLTAGSVKLILSPKSHGELLIFEGSSHTPRYKHQIKLEESSKLKSTWFFIEPHASEHNVQLERFVEINKKGTFYDHQIFASQSALQLHSNIKLIGEYAQSLSAGCLLTDYGQFHYEPIQEHFAKHAKSSLNFKVVLTKRARSFFRGLIVLHKDAQKSEAYQENKNLLLSRNARADSEPRLEIIPNDVFCKHGSATAELDNKQLYYLMSRGFSKQDAKTLIVKSFCAMPLLHPGNDSNFLPPFINLATEHIFATHPGILNS